MFKRLLITAAVSVIFGGALVSCGDSGAGSGETLRWRSAVDVPVNFSRPIGNDLDFSVLLPEIDCDELTDAYPELFEDTPCDELTPEKRLDLLTQLPVDPNEPGEPEQPDGYIFDVDKGTVSTGSDVIDFLRKLTDTKIQYSITAANNTKISLTFFGMLFSADDFAAMNDTVGVFYKAIEADDTVGGRVNMFGKTGMFLPKNSVGRYPIEDLSDPLQGKRLGNLVTGKKPFAYRWLVKLDDISDLTSSSETTDSIAIKLRIRFSGVNSMDALFNL